MESTQETLIGYRQFKVNVDPFQQRLKLEGSFGGIWLAGVEQATCGANLKGDQLIKNSQIQAKEHISSNSCHCGIYSFTDKARSEFILEYGRMQWSCTNDDFYEQDGRIHTAGKPLQIISQAQVLNWGAMVEGSQGWRSEFCKIEQLWLNRPKEKCPSCGWGLIPSTINNRSNELHWLCDFKEGQRYDQLMNGLHSQLSGYYQCPVSFGVE